MSQYCFARWRLSSSSSVTRPSSDGPYITFYFRPVVTTPSCTFSWDITTFTVYVTACDPEKSAFSKIQSKLDSCIVWNAHNTVFGSKRSAICTQAVYFPHSTMSSVTCLRLSDFNVIYRVTYLQFPIQACFSSTSVSQVHSGLLGLLIIGHRYLHDMSPQYLIDCCIPTSDIASRQRLWSATHHQLIVPRHRCSRFGRRAFFVAARCK